MRNEAPDIDPNHFGRAIVPQCKIFINHHQAHTERNVLQCLQWGRPLSHHKLFQEVDEVLINGQLDRLEHYLCAEGCTEHNPHMADGLPALRSALAEPAIDGKRILDYNRIHRLLAERNFLLSVREGFRDGVHSSFYDLFRVADGKIVEHWDTTEAIPPRTAWKNNNGKF